MFTINYNYEGTPITCLGVESWSEMTAQQFLPAVRTIYNTAKYQPEARYMLPLICTNIPKEHYKKFNNLQAVQMVAAFDFLLEYKDLPVKWLVPKLEIVRQQKLKDINFILPKTVLYGPDDKLKNLIFEEFIYAESMFDAYIKKQDEKFLNQFVAILYRPKARKKHLTGDVREAFNKHGVEQRAEIVKMLPAADKQAIMLNYIGCKAIFPNLYGDLFSTTEEKNEKNTSFGWLDIAYRISDHKPTELETLKGQNLHEVLASLNLKLKDNKALKAEIEAYRNKK
jgi:hypothetical protein